MKRLLLIILLAIFSNGAMAEWKLIDFDQEANNFYIEPTSIKKQGNKLTVWMLDDYFLPQTDIDDAKSYSSSKNKVAIDCKKETVKFLAAFHHKGQMGEGEIVQINNAESFDYPIPPNSILESVLKATCGKNG